jgi:predicted GNAT superfamily acetyltransferase
MTSIKSLSSFAINFEHYFHDNKNNLPLAVSPVEIEGLPEIVKFYEEAYKSNRWFGTQMGSRNIRNFFSDALMAPKILWLKLTSDGQTAGFSALFEDGDFLYSDETLISPAFQGRGIATIYFRALCEVAQQQQKSIYGDIIYSKHTRVITRIFADEFGLVPIGFVLARIKQQSPLVMVRVATQKSLQDLNRYDQVRLISDAIYKNNNELKGSSQKCIGFNHDTNTPMLLDDQEVISYLLTQSDQTEVRPVACLLELIKLQLPLVGAECAK